MHYFIFLLIHVTICVCVNVHRFSSLASCSRTICFRPLLIPDLRVGHCFTPFDQMTADQLDGEPGEHRDVRQHEGVQRRLGPRGDGARPEVPGALIQLDSEEKRHQDEAEGD